MSDVPTLQTLLDRAEIRDVMARYARGLDRRDFDLAASCFTDAAVADHGGERATGHGAQRVGAPPPDQRGLQALGGT